MQCNDMSAALHLSDAEQAQHQHHESLVIFVAYGTRGDVQPVACLACHLQHSKPSTVVTFITHAAHHGWLTNTYAALDFSWVDTPPACPAPTHHTDSAADPSKQYQEFSGFEQHLKTLKAIQDCVTASGASLHIHSTEPNDSAGHVQRASVQQPLEVKTQALLVFNLFALEVYSIAEAFNTRCVAVHPYIIPYRAPAGFARAFETALPQLYRALNQQPEKPSAGQQPAEALSEQQPETSSTAQQATAVLSVEDASANMQHVQEQLVSWTQVQHWMWALFSTRWHALRNHLNLASWPLHMASWPGGRGTQTQPAVQQPLPAATPLLYGFSHSYIPRPNFWPASVHIAGFWQPKLCCHNLEQIPAQLLQQISKVQDIKQQNDAEDAGRWQDDPLQLACVDSGSTNKLGCIDLGSTARLMGLLPDAGRCAWIIASALEACNRKAIVLTGGWHQLHDACSQLEPALQDRLLLYDQPVSHQALCPHIAFLLHPAGSGTTAAGLLGGVPHVVLPQHFDQFSHAERLHDLGLAPAPLPRTLFGRAAQVSNGNAIANSNAPHACSVAMEELSDTQDGSGMQADDVRNKRRRVEVAQHVIVQPYELDKECQEAVSMLAAAIQQAVGADIVSAGQLFQLQLQQEECGLDAGVRLLQTFLA